MKLRPRQSSSLSKPVEKEIAPNARMEEISSVIKEEPTIIDIKSEPSTVVITVKLKTKRKIGRPRQQPLRTDSTVCDICGKVFKNLPEHLKRHLEVKPLSCNICEKRFLTAAEVNSHIKSHLKERSFSCSLCAKAFTRSSLLNYHMRIHTGERPYRCDKCGMTFSRPFGLAQHKNSVHVDGSLKPFKCEPCNKYFSTASDFQDHTRVRHTKETPYSCSVCHKKYPARKHLSLHVRTVHDQNVPLNACPKTDCPKTFKQQYQLNDHIRREHPNEALFKCPLCSASFAMKSQLNQHMRKSGSHTKS